MILIGQYDSPFVRRVGIALTLYELPFEHQPWSVFGDGERIAPLNPLVRVPTLALDDGLVLVESHAMLDYLDSLVPAERALFPRREPARHRALRVAGLAMGLAEKAVSLFYELRLHDSISNVWAGRCRGQIGGVLAALEQDRAERAGDWWFDDRIGHADIALACALRFASDAHPDLVVLQNYPALAAHSVRCEALDVFQTISQPFIPPA
ncbi:MULTISPECIES: glutathione S-transferase family protein [unclassified Bosea (in: a-proteobacteria)]|uniref:glutathione S-transferase family protein n=1 Tax=unclassified Bosea (in: a-proteobacteria) TaxID=2653178 RepID=UPI000F7634C5|nr:MULTISPECIES: glutathione S-transferase family protein [unclassified Bosea (in: a-proteobacteria)]AZO77767.1 glutathione S-transferase [Bosea sp. Tri-49]RXT18382.1 glutathione S-transferase [Bosea sp. Tri-39]RXT32979.1 glutathione S-transferase [Bosea sp. Tri-54]